jgi:hypothetical protein
LDLGPEPHWPKMLDQNPHWNLCGSETLHKCIFQFHNSSQTHISYGSYSANTSQIFSLMTHLSGTFIFRETAQGIKEWADRFAISLSRGKRWSCVRRPASSPDRSQVRQRHTQFPNQSEQCCGSVTFWYGSGSADLCLWLTDSAPDPVIFVIDLQDVKILLSSSKNSKKTLVFFCFVTFSWLFILEKLCKFTFKK